METLDGNIHYYEQKLKKIPKNINPVHFGLPLHPMHVEVQSPKSCPLWLSLASYACGSRKSVYAENAPVRPLWLALAMAQMY